MLNQSLNGTWRLYFAPEPSGRPQDFSEESLKNWESVSSSVPGNTQLDLFHAGIEPEPFYADNIHRYRKYEYYQWVYEKEFFVDKSLRSDRYVLKFSGIDTISDIYLNGTHIGSAKNMFIEHEFDVTDIISLEGENKLIVHIHSSMNYVRNKEYTMAMWGTAHRNEICHIRKAPHCFGWDIAPRIVSAGLWRSVEICAVSNTRITETYYACSSLKDGNVTFQYAVRFTTDRDTLENLKIRIHGKCGDHSFEFIRPAHFVSMNYTAVISNARLWWPYGYGEQNLYDLTMELMCGDTVLDTKKERIGLRTLSLEQRFDVGNQQFRFIVNNKPFFAKGTNWVPLDAFHSRDAERVERAHKLLTECGCNMIRCWGGNVYEDNAFFSLCDEAGILVWQDFAMGNTNYPKTEEFIQAINKEASSVIKKLRNHPSVAVWCSDNEIDYKNEANEAPSRLSYRNHIAYDVLPSICASHDPYRVLIKSSPEIPEGFNMFNVPEQHLWGWRSWYRDKFYTNNTAKFVSEYGFHGCPAPSGIRRYIPEDSVWPLDNIFWAVHSTEDVVIEHSNARNKMMRAQVKLMYGEVPDDINEFALLSQLYQAEAFKFFMEHCRSRNDFHGLLWWNMIDCWPQISDSVVDYYFNKKIAFHYLKRTQEPVLCFVTPTDGYGWNNQICVSNHTHNEAEVKVTISDGDTGEEIFRANSSVEADTTKSIGAIAGIPTRQRLMVIKYSVDGKEYANHFITGYPAYKKEDMLRWFRIIKSLDTPFDFMN